MFIKATRTIGYVMSIILLIAVFTNGYLSNTYFYYPQIPSPEEGKVVPFQIKSRVVYVTQDQAYYIIWLKWITYSSGIIFIATIIVNKINSNKRKD